MGRSVAPRAEVARTSPGPDAGSRSRARAVAALAAVLCVAGCGEDHAAPAPIPAPAAAPASPPRASTAAGAGHARMLEVLRGIRDRTLDECPFQGDFLGRALEEELRRLPERAPAAERWRILGDLGDRLVYFGREREGLARLQEAYDLMPSTGDAVPTAKRAEFLLRMGAAWMRFAETENCCARHAPESCILPLQGAALHTKPEGSRRAVALLVESMALSERESPTHLQAVWLRNMAAMTLGEYPDGVPERDRIPPSYFGPDEPFPRFENVVAKVGLGSQNMAGGAVADDFDGDGDIDLFVSDWDRAGQLRYWRNEGDGTFVDRTKEANLTGLFGGLNMIHADYDGDGRLDLLVLRGAWLGERGRHPNSLLHNEGDGTFTDRTFEAGLGEENYPSPSAVFLDYDNDGDLDLYVANETSDDFLAPCQFYRNEGNGTFTERAAEAGVRNERFTKAVVAGDFDGDRYPDIYASNLDGQNRLYRNRRDGTFEDIAPALGVTRPVKSFGAWFWDFDNDGALDITVCAFRVPPSDMAAAALGLPYPENLPMLYRGDGKGGFTEVGRAQNLVKPCSPMGLNVGDIDNDGFLDIYLGTGRPEARDLVPNLLYRNRRGTGFADVTVPSGMGHLQKGHGVAFADFDLDGDLDVFAQMGGAYAADKFHNAMFENPGFGNHWLAVRLSGRKSNRCGMGARIRAEIVEDGQQRSIYRTVGSGGNFGASPLRQHLGLGRADKVETLEVFWPTTGKTQVFRGIPADRVVEVVEGEDRPTVREVKAVNLGGGPRR